MFLLSWTAWEALRTRFLRLVIKRMGWSIKDADQVMRDLRISSMESTAKVMVNLGMIDPSRWQGSSGRIWRKLLEVQQIRHRLAHGFDSRDPKLIYSASQFVLASLDHRSWLEDLEFKIADQSPFSIGDLFAHQAVGPKRDGFDQIRLRGMLVKSTINTGRRKRLPSTVSLQKVTNELTI